MNKAKSVKEELPPQELHVKVGSFIGDEPNQVFQWIKGHYDHTRNTWVLHEFVVFHSITHWMEFEKEDNSDSLKS